MLEDIQFSNADFDLRQWKWGVHGKGYAIKGSHVGERYAHRIVLARKLGRELLPGELCDHINRNKLDNRRENLRVADKSLNTINRNIRPDNTTGYIGVHLCWPKEYREKGWAKRWNYIICRKGQKTIYSKMYKSPEEAHKARLEHILLQNSSSLYIN